MYVHMYGYMYFKALDWRADQCNKYESLTLGMDELFFNIMQYVEILSWVSGPWVVGRGKG